MLRVCTCTVPERWEGMVCTGASVCGYVCTASIQERVRVCPTCEEVMARRTVLQEIPILVPQTEQQSYEIVSEDEAPIPYNKPIASSAEWPHSRYISNDESKENITPNHLEDIFKEISPVSDLYGSDIGDDPGPTGSGHTSHSSTKSESSPKRNMKGGPEDLPPCNTPTDVSVRDLGVSSEGFTSKSAEKSPKSLHKHRRRSTIGVRGSPEMNFLIRQIALQRSNRNSDPEPLDNKPFTSPRNSILREKISAFRNAFQVVEETDKTPSFPGFSEVKVLEFEKGDMEAASEPPEKRKKLHDATNQGVSSGLHKPSLMSCPSHPLESSLKFMPDMTVEPDYSRLTTEVFSKPGEVQIDEAETLPSSSRSRKRKVMFADLSSPPEPEPSVSLISETSFGPVLKPALKKTPRRDFVLFGAGEKDKTLFSLPETSDDEENSDINDKSEDSMKKKKRVTFGRALSPELFDKTLPANTPLRRGSTPYNYRTPDATPSAEQSTFQSPCDPMPQPDFDDKDEVESLLPLSLCFDAEVSIIDDPAPSPLPGLTEESGPEEEEEAAVDTSSSADGHVLDISCNEAAEETHAEVINESITSSPDVSSAGHRETRSCKKRKMSDTEETPESDGSTVRIKPVAKKSRKSAIIRVQVKALRGKGKKRGRKSKKSAQTAVHSEREVVSKKPLLSPILELPECGPTPPAPVPQGLHQGKHLVEKVQKAGKVQKNKTQFTLHDSSEVNLAVKDPGKLSVHIVGDAETQDEPAEPTLEEMKVSKSLSPEKMGDLPASGVLDLTHQGECPLPSVGMEVTDQFSKLANGLSPSLEKEKRSKTKNAKRRSSTRRYVSHPPVTSQDADDTSHKPESIDDPVQGTLVLSSEENTSTCRPPITSEPKKSRRSSRNLQVSNTLPANPEENTLGEHGTALLPYSDSSMSDFCLPIGDFLQFPPQEKKVRRSMRLRRDSGVNGLSWVAESKEGEMTGRRKSVSSVMRRESSALMLEVTVQNPDMKNLNDYQVLNTARRNRRRTLGTATIQESVATCDTKRRRSNCSYKAPSSTPALGDVHHVLGPDV